MESSYLKQSAKAVFIGGACGPPPPWVTPPAAVIFKQSVLGAKVSSANFTKKRICQIRRFFAKEVLAPGLPLPQFTIFGVVLEESIGNFVRNAEILVTEITKNIQLGGLSAAVVGLEVEAAEGQPAASATVREQQGLPGADTILANHYGSGPIKLRY